MCCPSWRRLHLRHIAGKPRIWCRKFSDSRQRRSSWNLSKKILQRPVIYYTWCIGSSFCGNICPSPARPRRNIFSGTLHNRFSFCLWNEANEYKSDQTGRENIARRKHEATDQINYRHPTELSGCHSSNYRAHRTKSSSRRWNVYTWNDVFSSIFRRLGFTFCFRLLELMQPWARFPIHFIIRVCWEMMMTIHTFMSALFLRTMWTAFTLKLDFTNERKWLQVECERSRHGDDIILCATVKSWKYFESQLQLITSFLAGFI